MLKQIAVLVLSASIVQIASGQGSSAAITNADIISMAKAGIGEQTIILTIQRGPAKLDASPQALIVLKKAGLSDQVLNAVLAATGSQSAAASRPSQSAPATELDKGRSDAPLQEAPAKLEQIAATLYKWLDANGKVIVCTQIHYSSPCNVPANTYAIREGHAGTITAAGDFIEDQSSKEFPTRYLEYNGANVQKLLPSETDAEVFKVDESQLSQYDLPSEIKKTLEADKRATQARIQDADKRHEQELLEQRKQQAEANSAPPVNTAAAVPAGPTGLTLRVLQSESVPYTQESRGSVSTTCSIVGDASTSAYASSFGNSAYGNSTTNWNQRMRCNSYDTMMRWPHVLNVMFVRASDGNSYIIGCDRAWRWSKCVSLRAGDTFNARFTEKGIEVEAVNSKGKDVQPTYHILQSAVSR